MPNDDYAHATDAVMIRLYEEDTPDGAEEWFIDAVDADGRYTEACWSFDTEGEASATIPEFCSNHGIDPNLPVGPALTTNHPKEQM